MIGGGIAGLSAAAAFAAAGFETVCVDPGDPMASTERDHRSTAFLQNSRNLLDDIGLWDHLAPDAQPLQTMRLIDAGGRQNTPRENAAFNSAEISDAPFGWNLANWRIKKVLGEVLHGQPRVSFRASARVNGLFVRAKDAHLSLSTGDSILARLVVAADGRGSFIRSAHGIGVKRRSYGQKALVFTVTHEQPHKDTSIEIHRTGGPFTLVPLPDLNGRYQSAVVWMEDGPKAMRLSKLPPEGLSRAATSRSCLMLGRLDVTSDVALWPIISQLAHRMYSPRTALVAEAAHVLPPIGAQGLNLSLADIAELAALVTDAKASDHDIGAERLLRRYHAARWPDALARVAGTMMLNDAARTHSQPLRDLRRIGLATLHRVPPLRRLAMRTGLGQL